MPGPGRGMPRPYVQAEAIPATTTVAACFCPTLRRFSCCTSFGFLRISRRVSASVSPVETRAKRHESGLFLPPIQPTAYRYLRTGFEYGARLYAARASVGDTCCAFAPAPSAD